MEVSSKTPAVVTGGASGLGEATARALAAKGAKVAIFDMNEEKGEAVANDIGGIFCKVNVTSDEDVDVASAKASKCVLRREDDRLLVVIETRVDDHGAAGQSIKLADHLMIERVLFLRDGLDPGRSIDVRDGGNRPAVLADLGVVEDEVRGGELGGGDALQDQGLTGPRVRDDDAFGGVCHVELFAGAVVAEVDDVGGGVERDAVDLADFVGPRIHGAGRRGDAVFPRQCTRQILAQMDRITDVPGVIVRPLLRAERAALADHVAGVGLGARRRPASSRRCRSRARTSARSR